MTVYLLCFTNDAGEHVLFSGHAGHYMGETDKPVDVRRDEHQSGHGAKLTAAASAAGITFVIARTWPGRYTEERHLKGRRRGSRELKEKCPNCHPMPRIDRWAGGKPAWARQTGAGNEHETHQRDGQRHSPAVTRAPAPPSQPRRDPYEDGTHTARYFLAAQEQAGRTVSQIEATHHYITGPWREMPRHTDRAAEEMRGYTETIARRLAELRDAERDASAQAGRGAEMELEAAG